MFWCLHFGTGVATVERNSGVTLSMNMWGSGKVLRIPCLHYNGCRIYHTVLWWKIQHINKCGVFAFSFQVKGEIRFWLRNSSPELWQDKDNCVKNSLTMSSFGFKNSRVGLPWITENYSNTVRGQPSLITANFFPFGIEWERPTSSDSGVGCW